MLISLKEYLQERLDFTEYYDNLELRLQPNQNNTQLYEKLIRLYLETHIKAMVK
jgi:hypothetical protein